MNFESSAYSQQPIQSEPTFVNTDPEVGVEHDAQGDSDAALVSTGTTDSNVDLTSVGESPTPGTDDTQGGPDHDVAVEQYLSELLGRYNSETDGALESDPTPATEHSDPVAPADLPTDEQQDPEIRRPVRPEAAADMSAMREIANAAAHRAIATHTNKRTIAFAYSKLLLAVIGLAASYLLMQMSASAGTVTYFIGVCALGVGGYWSYQYVQLAAAVTAAATAAQPEIQAEPSVIIGESDEDMPDHDSMSDTQPITDELNATVSTE